MSYTFTQTGDEIQAILNRAQAGGQLDNDINALEQSKQDVLTFDTAPTAGSTNPATSGGIYDAIQAGGATVLAAFATDTASGAIASFTDGADNIPVKSLTVNLTPIQSGSGDPSPDNVRPISGRSEVDVARAGATLDSDLEQGGLSSSGLNAEGNTQIRTASYLAVAEDEQYAIAATPTDSSVTLNVAVSGYAVDDFTTARTWSSGWQSVPYTFAVPNGVRYVRLLIRKASDYAIIPAHVHDVLLGSTYPITIGQTVYAGTVDYLGGGKWQIQPTHAVVDMGSLTWAYNSTYSCFRSNNLNGQCIAPSAFGDTSAVCSMFKRADFNAGLNNGEFCVADSGWSPSTSTVVAMDTNYTDAAQFQTAVTGQTLVYALKTLPDPIIVDGPDPTTLLGDNNVWSDGGDVTVEYRADTKLYVQKLVGGGSLTLGATKAPQTVSLGRADTLEDSAEPAAILEPEVAEDAGQVADEPNEEASEE